MVSNFLYFKKLQEHLSGVYIGEGGAITQVTMTCDSGTLVLALATFGGVT
jgi:hypothetical protein